MFLGKVFSVIILSFLLASCGGGGDGSSDGSGAEQDKVKPVITLNGSAVKTLAKVGYS